MAKLAQDEKSRQAKQRKYGRKPSYPIPLWNGILEHHNEMGVAIWEFIWCVDKVTEEDEHGIGWCLGKTPIDVSRVARDLRENEKTARANLEHLEQTGYIRRKRTPRGYVIGVHNSRKFDAFRHKNDPESDRKETSDHSDVIGNFPPSDRKETTGSDRKKTSDASLLLDKELQDKKTNSKERGANTAPRDLSIAIPEWIPTQPWAAFLKFRGEQKKPMSTYQQELAIKKLDEFRSEGQNLAAVLEQSMVNGWIGIFRVHAKRLDSNTRVLTDDERLGLSRSGYGKTTADENARAVRYAEQLFKTLEKGTYDALKKELLAHGETFDCERVRALIRAIPKTNWPDGLKKTGE
jgi:hypothetical protein